MSKRAPKATLTQRQPDDVQVQCLQCGLALWQCVSVQVPIYGFDGEPLIDCPFAQPCEYEALGRL